MVKQDLLQSRTDLSLISDIEKIMSWVLYKSL